MRSIALVSAFTLTLALSVSASAIQTPQGGVDPRPPNGQGQVPAFPGQTRAPERKAGVAR
jgi:hypothetical protein